MIIAFSNAIVAAVRVPALKDGGFVCSPFFWEASLTYYNEMEVRHAKHKKTIVAKEFAVFF
jgi:hypothetical protein